METVYFTLFVIGVVVTLITVVFGDFFHLPVDFTGGALPYLSPTTIAAFVTVFGGCGVLLIQSTEWGAGLIGLVSLGVATIASSLLFFLVVLPLSHAEKSASKSSKDLIGKHAEVVTMIEAGRKGEIVYEQGGIRMNAPAKAQDGESIRSGERVVVVDEISGTFVVSKIIT